MPVPNETFVRIWQSSDDLAEAAERCGCGKNTASVRASKMRAMGVPLKLMGKGQRGEPADWARLAEIAQEVES